MASSDSIDKQANPWLHPLFEYLWGTSWNKNSMCWLFHENCVRWQHEQQGTNKNRRKNWFCSDDQPSFRLSHRTDGKTHSDFKCAMLIWGMDPVSNHQPHYCLHNRLFGCRSKKISKFLVTGLCAGNSPVTGEGPVTRKCFHLMTSLYKQVRWSLFHMRGWRDIDLNLKSNIISLINWPVLVPGSLLLRWIHINPSVDK